MGYTWRQEDGIDPLGVVLGDNDNSVGVNDGIEGESAAWRTEAGRAIDG